MELEELKLQEIAVDSNSIKKTTSLSSSPREDGQLYRGSLCGVLSSTLTKDRAKLQIIILFVCILWYVRTAFSPHSGSPPLPKEQDNDFGGRVDRAIMAGVDHVAPLRGYSTRSGKSKLQGNRMRSFSDLDSYAQNAKQIVEVEEPYRELKQALTNLNMLHFFGTLTSQGFGEIETILHTDPVVLTALSGMTDDESIDLLDQVDVE